MDTMRLASHRGQTQCFCMLLVYSPQMLASDSSSKLHTTEKKGKKNTGHFFFGIYKNIIVNKCVLNKFKSKVNFKIIIISSTGPHVYNLSGSFLPIRYCTVIQFASNQYFNVLIKLIGIERKIILLHYDIQSFSSHLKRVHACT